MEQEMVDAIGHDTASPWHSQLTPRETTAVALHPGHAFIKRCIDVAGAAMGLLIFSPVFAVLAVLIKLDSPGPVLFGQKRVGLQGNPFRMLKLRTMRDGAEQERDGLAYLNQTDDVRLFKIPEDPRVTRLGRIMRRWSFDELPQLYNVLRGDMSLVGPRPPLAYEVEQYKPWHCRRMVEAKPGITGLWQVTGRSRTTFDEMVRLDLRYARTCSIWNDIKILLATPKAVISGRGAC
jgi:lipopolysaccharide/colanic/teichoic acid biosynthesis glycosyltransferase